MTDSDDAWVAVMEMDATLVRVYCACVMIFPLSLLLVGLAKMRALKRSHAAAMAAYAAENDTTVGGGGGDSGGGGVGKTGPRLVRRQSSQQDSSTTGATPAPAMAWAATTVTAAAAQPSSPPAPSDKQPDNSNHTAVIALPAGRYTIEESHPSAAAPSAAAPTAPVAANSNAVATNANNNTTAASVTAAVAAPGSTLPPWYRHKSMPVAMLSVIAGVDGLAWCLQCVVRGSRAHWNIDGWTMGLGVAYVMLLGVGRIKVQHQLSIIGISMIAKTGKKGGRSAVDRRVFVRRFSFVLHMLLVANALCFLAIFIVLVILFLNPALRQAIAICMGAIIMCMLIVGPGSSFFITRSILRTLREHAENMASRQLKLRPVVPTQGALSPQQQQQQQQLPVPLPLPASHGSGGTSATESDRSRHSGNSSAAPIAGNGIICTVQGAGIAQQQHGYGNGGPSRQASRHAPLGGTNHNTQLMTVVQSNSRRSTAQGAFFRSPSPTSPSSAILSPSHVNARIAMDQTSPKSFLDVSSPPAAAAVAGTNGALSGRRAALSSNRRRTEEPPRSLASSLNAAAAVAADPYANCSSSGIASTILSRRASAQLSAGRAAMLPASGESRPQIVPLLSPPHNSDITNVSTLGRHTLRASGGGAVIDTLASGVYMLRSSTDDNGIAMFPLKRAHSDQSTPQQFGQQPTLLSPPQHDGAEIGSGSLTAPLSAAGTAATSRAITPTESPSRRPSFSHTHANGLAPNNGPAAVTIQVHTVSAGTQAPAQLSTVALASTTPVAATGAQAPAKVGALDQLAIWQAKLDQLKKSLVPMLLTVAVGLSIAVEPKMSSGMTLTFPAMIAATNIGLFVAAKQLPVDFAQQ